jgi:hypothetical protein
MTAPSRAVHEAVTLRRHEAWMAMVHHGDPPLSAEWDCPDERPPEPCVHSIAVGLAYLRAFLARIPQLVAACQGAINSGEGRPTADVPRRGP